MIEPIAILCRIGWAKWTTGRGGVQRKMLEILPIGEKERGEREEEEGRPEKERQVARP